MERPKPTGKVLKVVKEEDRTLLILELAKKGSRTSVDYYAIAGKNTTVKKGDIIQYGPEGYNFAWFIKKVKK